MSSSNVDETSEQTRGRETEPTARGRGRKDKSRDVIANMEVRLAKVELAMANTQERLDLIEQGMEKGMKDLREQIQDLREEILVSQTVMSARVMPTQKASKVEVPKPQGFSGKRDAKELDNCLWHMERYFEAITLTDEAAKVRTVTPYLTNTTTLWWSVQDLAIVIVVAESLTDYKRGDFSKVESVEDSHATGGGDGVSRDHNTPRIGSGKAPNIREGKREAHMGSMQLLGALQVNPKPSTLKTSLLSRVQVKEAKEECLEKVLETHLEVSRKGHDGDVDGIGGEECHKMLQMTLPMGLYRRWEASRDPWRHLHLATKWKSMEASREG
ncbi:hypothetical protein AAG906_021437 [Vitis piasezkii]